LAIAALLSTSCAEKEPSDYWFQVAKKHENRRVEFVENVEKSLDEDMYYDIDVIYDPDNEQYKKDYFEIYKNDYPEFSKEEVQKFYEEGLAKSEIMFMHTLCSPKALGKKIEPQKIYVSPNSFGSNFTLQNFWTVIQHEIAHTKDHYEGIELVTGKIDYQNEQYIQSKTITNLKEIKAYFFNIEQLLSQNPSDTSSIFYDVLNRYADHYYNLVKDLKNDAQLDSSAYYVAAAQVYFGKRIKPTAKLAKGYAFEVDNDWLIQLIDPEGYAKITDEFDSGGIIVKQQWRIY